MMKTLLWLDDIRNPHVGEWLRYSPLKQPFDVVWVKKYQEFVDWITENGLPDAICFDHDLENFHITKSTYKEYTGKDCANWLVDYCLDNNLKLPLYNIQSSNPAGAVNIDSLLKSYIKSYDAKTLDKK